jgi:anhydro-N-acetylmuramic acid kinase
MHTSLPFSARPAGERAVIGVRVTSDVKHVFAALVSVDGGGLGSRGRIDQKLRAELPHDAAATYRKLQHDGGIPPAALARLGAMLADAQAPLVRQLLADAKPQPLVAGLYDPGLWQLAEDCPATFVGLTDTARLAELTDLNVLDAFPARDLAHGGAGGPVLAIPTWLLAADTHRRRILVDLGRTARITVLPATKEPQSAAAVFATDAGPGTALLDELTRRLTEGRYEHDPGGRLAVQGRQIAPLLERLLEAPSFQEPVPRWNPLGVSPQWFLDEGIEHALKSGHSLRDLLCTATHLIAAAVAAAVRRCTAAGDSTTELVLTGGGVHNGLLLREIAIRLPGRPQVRIGSLGIDPQWLEAAATAMLCVLHVDHVPATHPLISGIAAPRVLGRLTPGAPHHWQRLLGHLAEGRPATMSLRSAV